jgi:hypothetical protein
MRGSSDRHGNKLILAFEILIVTYIPSLLWGYPSCCAYYLGLLVKPSSTTNIQDVFIFILFIATCSCLSDGHPQAIQIVIKSINKNILNIC